MVWLPDSLAVAGYLAVVFGPGLVLIGSSIRRGRRHRSRAHIDGPTRYEAPRLVLVRSADDTDTLTLPRIKPQARR